MYFNKYSQGTDFETLSRGHCSSTFEFRGDSSKVKIKETIVDGTTLPINLSFNLKRWQKKEVGKIIKSHYC